MPNRNDKIRRKVTWYCIVCHDPIPYKRAMRGATTCDSRKSDCKKILRKRRKEERILDSKKKDEIKFLEFLKQYDYEVIDINFIDKFLLYSKREYTLFNQQVPFEHIWIIMRIIGFKLNDHWRKPCKAYLKKHHPEICKFIKDLGN